MVKQGKNSQQNFAEALNVLDENLHYCTKCQNFSDGGLCDVCANNKRNHSQVCVTESPFDVLALENTASYEGVYHVLHGALSPIDGIRPQDLKIEELLKRFEEEEVDEVIFALSSTLEGEATAHFIKERLPENIKTTHIARGLPTGASLEYADEITLSRALRDRK